jgi:Ser/Thr protein kinase RdoA (MazF antagonist)
VRAAGVDDDPLAWRSAAATAAARTSRHARLVRVPTAAGAVFVKTWAPPGGWRARRAFRMGEALRRAGFAAPETLAAAWRSGEGLLVTRDVGGEDLLDAVAGRRGAAKRALLHALGATVGRLHDAGFVHGDLVPSNLRVDGDRIVFLDNDRTRRSRFLVALAGRRNLVQLGRFVVPGMTLADRARVLRAYAVMRGLSRGPRRRLAWWVVAKTTARRCAIDRIPADAARAAGYRELMRSGGRFDATAEGPA